MKRPPSRARIVFVLAVCAAIAGGILTIGGPKQEAQRIRTEPRLAGRYSDFARADRVTAEIRDPSRRLVRIDTTSETGRTAAASFGTIVEDYGTFVVASAPAGRKAPAGVNILKTTVHLPGAEFEPLPGSADAGPVAAALGAGTAPGEGYYMVQFGTVANDELLDSLRDAGVEVLQYIPHQAFLVYGSKGAIVKAAAHSRVRWTGAHRPEYKISPEFREQLRAARGQAGLKNGLAAIELTEGSAAKFNVAVVKREVLGHMSDEVTNATGGRIVSISDLPNNYFNVIQVEASVDTVEEISNIPGVLSIELVYQRLPEDERAAQIVAGNYTNSTTISGPGYNPLQQFGVDGTNVTVAVSDDGVNAPGNGPCYLSSANVVNAPVYDGSPNARGGHGHLNASIIAGSVPSGVCGRDPNNYNYGVGIAPRAHIINIPFLNNSSTDAQAANDVVTVAGPNGNFGSISNNSWGAGTNGNAYTSYAAEYDGLVRDSSSAGSFDPVVFVFSAGNSASAGLTEPKVAKNIIAVGSSENLRSDIGSTSADSIDDISSFSSRGPAADGRVKPDIIAPGGVITGSRTAFTCVPPGTFNNPCPAYSDDVDANHVYSSGTSHAAPQIAGVAALFTQFWKNGHGGVNPSPAMVKAAIINTGQNLTGTGATGPLPNGSEGWGRVNMKFMFNTGTSVSRFDQSSALGTVGAVSSYSGTVTDVSKPVRVTLVWTDPPGAADPALVNNLDLAVTVGGNTYRGNVFSNGASIPGGSADTLNNVENVWLPAGVTGPITATVTAASINGDGVLGNADLTDQNFALVFYNVDASGFGVSGRVHTSQGRGITNAVVTITDNNGFMATDVTGRNGIFEFTGVPGGQNYMVSVGSARFSFQPQTFFLSDSVAGLDFTPNP